MNDLNTEVASLGSDRLSLDSTSSQGSQHPLIPKKKTKPSGRSPIQSSEPGRVINDDGPDNNAKPPPYTMQDPSRGRRRSP